MDGSELYDKLRKMDNNINVCFLTAAQEYYDKYKERYSCTEKMFYNETNYARESSKYYKFNFKHIVRYSTC